MESIILRDTVAGEIHRLEVSGVLAVIDHDPRNMLVKGQMELDGAGYVKAATSPQTANLQGVFTCGDLVDHTYRQVATATGSDCQAALDAERWLTADKA